jgi:hypothetical protein
VWSSVTLLHQEPKGDVLEPSMSYEVLTSYAEHMMVLSFCFGRTLALASRLFVHAEVLSRETLARPIFLG